MIRCGWCGEDPLYVAYHDHEWGVPLHDDQLHFEFLILEGFQAGLSWYTILKKRDHFRLVFDQFRPDQVAGYGLEKIESLMQDPGIIRNRLKIEAAINNANRFLDLQAKHGLFDHFIWDYVDGKPIQNTRKTMKDLPASTPLSDRLSKDLKKLGFKFVGSTIMYAHMQAIGLVNDHLLDCFRYEEIKKQV